MPEKLKHPINIKLTDKQYEDFIFIVFMQKKKVSKVIRDFIDEYIQKNIDIIKHDDTHCDIYVETKDGKREWINIPKEQEGNYTYIDSKKVFVKKKGEKLKCQ
jgi:hypothetical protein